MVGWDGVAQAVATWGYLAVFLAVAVNAAGIPFPGETALLAAAVYASRGGLQIGWVIALAAGGAVAGFQVGYVLGRSGGHAVLLRLAAHVHFGPPALDRLAAFFARHGDKTVLLARFVSLGRLWGGLMAGLHRMPAGVFLVYNVLGGLIWALTFGLLGFELGHSPALLRQAERVLGVTGSVLVVAVVGLLAWLERRRHHRFHP